MLLLPLSSKDDFEQGKKLTYVILLVLLQVCMEVRINGYMLLPHIVSTLVCMRDVDIKVHGGSHVPMVGSKLVGGEE